MGAVWSLRPDETEPIVIPVGRSKSKIYDASLTDKLAPLGLALPRIRLPNETVDMEKWACVACDQYTAEPEYWKAVDDIVGEGKSTLRLFLPEVYLEETAEQLTERQVKITSSMEKYAESVLKPGELAPILVERTIKGRKRLGLMMLMDLESYDYTPGSQSLIRPTEKTIPDRLPPRVAIRKQAPVELPHILVLINDPKRTVLEPLQQVALKEGEKVYDFDLMKKGGRIAGYKLNQDMVSGMVHALEKLADPANFMAQYEANQDHKPMLFGVGDGNHSLASAKAMWEEMKKSNPPSDHPARYALVEIENIHDEANEFEPIHRLLFNVPSVDTLLDQLINFFPAEEEAILVTADQYNTLPDNPKRHVIEYQADQSHRGFIVIEKPSRVLTVASLQAALDEYLHSNNTVTIDFIHGTEAIDKHRSEKNIGFIVPPMEKNDLFRTVIFDGVLPRKTFSMGEAHEKRYYLECRDIRTAKDN